MTKAIAHSKRSHGHRRKAKAPKGFRWVFSAVHSHPVFKHSHNLAYCVYYGIALAEDHGVQFAIVAFLFCVAVVVAMAEGTGN